MLKPKFNLKDWSNLSDQQSTAVKWVIEGNGSLELNARAGCGKTYTLVQMILAIAKYGLGEALLMAYNKKIADELQTKLQAANVDWRTASAGTCHSIGFKAWMKVAKGVAVNDKKVVEIVKDMAFMPDVSRVYIECQDAVVKMVSLAKQRAIGHLCSIDDIYQWEDIYEHFGIENDVSGDWMMHDILEAAKKVYRISLENAELSSILMT